MNEPSVTKPAETVARGLPVVGYVEAVTDKAAFGWAWCPGQPARLRIEAWLGPELVCSGTADERRDDLVSGGIGDGRHAFTLPLPPAVILRAAELRILACSGTGEATALRRPPSHPASDEILVGLQRSMNTLISSQRLLHRNLQAALLHQTPATSSLSEISSVQTRLEEAVATVELFQVRLENSRQAQPVAGRMIPAWPLQLAIGASTSAFLISCWAVYRTVVTG